MANDSDLPACKFGAKCYRKNPQHREAFSHPEPEQTQKKEDDPSPPRKKTKIDDFFGGKKNEKDEAETKEEEKTTKDENNSNETETSGASSGYKREEEESAGQSSGYVRDEELDDPSDDLSSTECPPSPEDVRENIKAKFLVEMPEDFYDLWNLAQTINKTKPTDAFKASLGLQLVGPFDILAGKHKESSSKSPCYLRHWRYYYDPPEFLTVIKGDDKTQFHMGYFRDDPREMPVFVASNAAKDSCTMTPRGDNIFAAILWFLEDKMRKEQIKGGVLASLKQKLTDAAETAGCSLDLKSKSMKSRDKKVVCRSFHGAGIVVPLDEETEIGYRPVPETPADLKKMFKKISEAKTNDERNKAMDPLMEITMLIQFANDECDYGEGLELGIDLFSYGGQVFHKPVLNLLPLAYQFLGRTEYGKIIQDHLGNRKHSADLSVL